MSDSAVVGPVRRRRRWLMAIGVGLVVGGAAVGYFAPELTCAVIRAQTPWLTPGVVIRGARCAGPEFSAMAVVTIDRATLHRIVELAAERWVPAAILADGQQAWGTVTQAPEITWRLQIDERQATPRLNARIPLDAANQALARLGNGNNGTSGNNRPLPLTAIRLTACEIVAQPTAPGASAWTIALAGSAQVTFGGQTVPLQITSLRATAHSQLSRRPDGTQSLRASVEINELTGTVALIGSLASLKPIVQQQLNQRLEQDLPQALVPNWWPEATEINVSLAPVVMTEM